MQGVILNIDMYKGWTYKSPTNLNRILWHSPSVFLAGSIEMGKAEDWQTRATSYLAGKFIVLNPRREEWDASWEQDPSNKEFREQVQWELDALERADHIIVYFQPGTMSPISLLELGLHAKSGKAIAICPEGFWRRGNVLITCQKYKVPVVPTLEDATALINKRHKKL